MGEDLGKDRLVQGCQQSRNTLSPSVMWISAVEKLLLSHTYYGNRSELPEAGSFGTSSQTAAVLGSKDVSVAVP